MAAAQSKNAPTLLYIGAHDVDFLVRAGGTLAKYARNGSRVVSASLTMGERQESSRLWRERPSLSISEVVQIRRAEAQQCAQIIGSELREFGWDDCPIIFERGHLLQLAALIQEIRPRILITHWPKEDSNWDHASTGHAVMRARQYAKAPGSHVETGLQAWEPAAIYYSEPAFPFPDRSRFRPNVWVDITDTFELKAQGLDAAPSHGHLEFSYRRCAEFRGYQAARATNDPSIRYAEAFFTETPWVGNRLPFEG